MYARSLIILPGTRSDSRMTRRRNSSSSCLKGATLDADERAGLKILNKVTDQDMLDWTLESLDDEDRFDQLLDDYHGKEYRDLLELLSEKIKNYKVKALLLDEFVGMWWVNLDEERAIVVILERTDPADRAQLLTQPESPRCIAKCASTIVDLRWNSKSWSVRPLGRDGRNSQTYLVDGLRNFRQRAA